MMVNNRFRIIPYGADEYAVQKRWVGLIWFTMARMIGIDTYAHYTFENEAAAEQFITDLLADERSDREWHRQERVRKESIKPRNYP